MHFPSQLRFRRKHRSPTEMSISAPQSQPFDYGSTGVPPWMNDYATHLTYPVTTPHAARKNYHTKHPYLLPSRPKLNTGVSSGWDSDSSRSATSSMDGSVDLGGKRMKLVAPEHDPNLPPPLLQVLPLPKGRLMEDAEWQGEEEPGTPVKIKKRGFWRNRGLDERGRLASEWEEVYDADWGCPEEYERGRRWYD